MYKKYTPNKNKYIGKGSFGKIYKSNEDESIVIKKIKKRFFDKALQIYNDELITITQEHKNLTHIYDYFIIDNTFNIVLEYLDGKDLFDIIVDNNGLAEPVYISGEVIETNEKYNSQLSLESNMCIKYTIKKLLKALNYLHNNGIVHCDVKPENIRVLINGSIKLFDYTLINKIESNLYNVGCTFGYAAPEIIFFKYNDIRYGNKLTGLSDIWSLGIMIYLMVECLHLIPTSTKKYISTILHHNNDNKFNMNFDMNKWDNELLKLFDSMVVFDPKNRKSADEILKEFY